MCDSLTYFTEQLKTVVVENIEELGFVKAYRAESCKHGKWLRWSLVYGICPSLSKTRWTLSCHLLDLYGQITNKLITVVICICI